jgi:hypothetical protein
LLKLTNVSVVNLADVFLKKRQVGKLVTVQQNLLISEHLIDKFGECTRDALILLQARVISTILHSVEPDINGVLLHVLNILLNFEDVFELLVLDKLKGGRNNQVGYQRNTRQSVFEKCLNKARFLKNFEVFALTIKITVLWQFLLLELLKFALLKNRTLILSKLVLFFFLTVKLGVSFDHFIIVVSLELS